jgi:3-methylcrotonyl-CoA carboxylase alpha subunit
VFIGPPPSAIRAMGSKSASKDIMIRANVPVIPGYHGENQDIEVLKKEAKKIGYPVLIKAVMGGGGKGMRIVETEEDLEDSVNSSKREAISSFGDDRVLVEKYIRHPRYAYIFIITS